MRSSLFQSTTTSAKSRKVTLNAAGGAALDPGAEAALAQMALTCTLADGYYTKADAQLHQVIALCDNVSPGFVAKLAVYAREVGQMKDLPALLMYYLSARGHADLVNATFHRVVNNGRMLRTFCQMLFSGRLGKRRFGSQLKRLVRGWFAQQGANGVFANSVGSNPTLRDIIKLARPVPLTPDEGMMYKYLISKGEPVGNAALLQAWSEGLGPMPSLPFEYLAGGAKNAKHWNDIAKNLSWNATLKNLNTFARHSIDQPAWAAVEQRLLTPPPKHVFPYSIMTAYRTVETNPNVPMPVKLAVQTALDNAVANVPATTGSVAVLVDVSGSMSSPVTGLRGSATGVTTCIEVAGLVAGIFLNKNPTTRVLAFDTSARPLTLNPRDSIITNARKIATPGGGTDVSCGLYWLLKETDTTPDLTVIVSDNESWFDSRPGYPMYGRAPAAQGVWDKLAMRNPRAKLVCLNLQCEPTVQVFDNKRTLNLGGFSDQVLTHIVDFAKGEFGVKRLLDKVHSVTIE